MKLDGVHLWVHPYFCTKMVYQQLNLVLKKRKQLSLARNNLSQQILWSKLKSVEIKQ